MAAIILATLSLGAAPSPHPLLPDTRITATAGAADWRVDYVFPAPVAALHFARSPGDRRTTSWTAPPGFEILRLDEDEIVRRRDRGPFAAVTLAVPPVYGDLPKDYAPFSRFGDGGMLFHSGRFFACSAPCEATARWPITLVAPPDTPILLDGRRYTGTVRWVDRDDGRNIYLGRNKPVETPDLVAMLDGALPPAIRTRLIEQLPAFMHFFAARLGRLPQRPMLFASYDLAHQGGYGRQGGTLPGQVFVHFYGSRWPELMQAPDFAQDLAWFFAHEAGHLYQRQVTTSDETGAWIHEGGAEAFASLATSAAAPAFAEAKRAKAQADCAKRLGNRSLHDVLAAHDFDASYSCGLLVNLWLDQAVRARDPDGLFAVWRDYIARAERGGGSEAGFLASVAAVGGAGVATQVARMIDRPKRMQALLTE
ncbi:hypothetical protein [Sphingomonas crusticola]|uniref:hypothetical protein n=1 Tax=Sphingomonas crusticola TaxID=1697973 RepID=UPI000E21E1B0|nr:hypothetical protein [Sphingomonas crusticola]